MQHVKIRELRVHEGGGRGPIVYVPRRLRLSRLDLMNEFRCLNDDF